MSPLVIYSVFNCRLVHSCLNVPGSDAFETVDSLQHCERRKTKAHDEQFHPLP